MPPPVTPVLPDVELVAVTYLRRPASALVALVGTRVYTVIPRDPVFPLVRLVRFGGGPVRSAPLHLEAATLQVDAYGGSKAEARRLFDTVRAELANIAYFSHAAAVVTGARFGAFRYLPDREQTPSRPRYSGDITILLHP